VSYGQKAAITIDGAPGEKYSGTISYISPKAEFTPKTVETAEERAKLMFRIKAKIQPALLEKYIQHVKTGLPGMAYVRLDPNVPWPAKLEGKLLQ